MFSNSMQPCNHSIAHLWSGCAAFFRFVNTPTRKTRALAAKTILSFGVLLILLYSASNQFCFFGCFRRLTGFIAIAILVAKSLVTLCIHYVGHVGFHKFLFFDSAVPKLLN